MGAYIAFLFLVCVCSTGTHAQPVPNLTRIYDEYNDTFGFDHWMEYGQHYQANIQHLLLLPDSHIHMLEIGVFSGGSGRVWRQYFGPRLKYTGVDINPKCKRFENPDEGIRIEIGSQTNRTFLQDLCTKYGPFHFIVDDGFHSTHTILTSLDVLWPCLRDRGVYAIEDLHTMIMWRGRPGMLIGGKDVFSHLADKIRAMHNYFAPVRSRPNNFTLHLASAQFFDSLAFLHYRAAWQPLTRFWRGHKFMVPKRAAQRLGGAPGRAQTFR